MRKLNTDQKNTCLKITISNTAIKTRKISTMYIYWMLALITHIFAKKENKYKGVLDVNQLLNYIYIFFLVRSIGVNQF